MITVGVSARVLDRNVGGNTRYSRNIHSATVDNPGYLSTLLRPDSGPELASNRSYVRYETFSLPRFTDCDVIHYPADTGGSLPHRRPVVATIHGMASLHLAGVRNPGREALWRFRVARLASIAAHVITPSISSKADIVDYFGVAPSDVSVIYHGVDGRFRDYEVNDRDRVALTTYGFPSNYVLYVGNLDPRKNLSALCKAANALWRSRGIPTVIAGAPAWDSGSIIEEIKSTTGVIYLGRLPEELLIPAYAHALLFCFPSLYEGFGLPVLEAMACGTAVVCSDRGSLKELASGAALVLDNLDAGSITDALADLLDDVRSREDLEVRGRERARDFDWAKSRRVHAEVFERVAE